MKKPFARARVVAAAALAGALLAAGGWHAAPASPAFDECAPPEGPVEVVVGAVACQRFHSAAIGGVTVFTYYVPPGCAPDLGRRCPVTFLLHGTGGNYQAMLGPVGRSSPPASVQALIKGPRVDPHTAPDAWNHASPATWEARPPIDMVLVAPHNMTVPGGYGPGTGTDGMYADWNPRYARDGDTPSYPTPPPRFESMIVDELVPFVSTHLPVGDSREYRALMGHSQGGLGVLKLGLQHPDVFSSLLPLSGASIPLGHLPGSQLREVAPGAGAPAPVPYAQAPGFVPPFVATPLPSTPIEGLVTGARAYVLSGGDPVADEAYWRGNTTQDLAGNARAWGSGGQALAIDMVTNDAVPYSPNDLANPTATAVSAGLEGFANYIVGMQRNAFELEGVAYHYEQHKGTHSGLYIAPFYRYYYERLYDRLRHWDGGGAPPPRADRFDYRSTARRFEVWGWRFAVDRQPTEFLQVRDASCSSLTLQGSGTVTVTVPGRCRTGVDGTRTFAVDLGASMPTDEHTPVGTTGLYGHSVTVSLESLHPSG